MFWDERGDLRIYCMMFGLSRDEGQAFQTKRTVTAFAYSREEVGAFDYGLCG